MMRRRARHFTSLAASLLLAAALSIATSGLAQSPTDDAALRAAFARPPLDAPVPDEPDAGFAKRAALGLKLFRDKRLSRDENFACESCHYHGLAFADPRQRAVGFAGDTLERNTPALWNLAFAKRFGWEGRDIRLEDQVLMPVVHTREMGGEWPVIVARLKRDAVLAGAFTDAFPGDGDVHERVIARALAAYVRTIVSPATRFDRWVGGKADALSETELAGLRLFAGKAGCAECHQGWRFTDDRVHATGFADAPALRTPTLRELLWSGPYFHDGSAATLAETLARHVEALGAATPKLRPPLSDAERSALVAFLASLSSEDLPRPVPRR
jgi:cytochrome c peroxidase